MTYDRPARTTPRRIGRIRVSGLLLVIAATAAALGYRSLAASTSTAAPPVVLRGEHRGVRGHALPNTVWPAYGQAAVQVGQSQVRAGPNQHVAAIVSVAKVMTAYLVLRDHPLSRAIETQGAALSSESATTVPVSPVASRWCRASVLALLERGQFCDS